MKTDDSESFLCEISFWPLQRRSTAHNSVQHQRAKKCDVFYKSEDGPRPSVVFGKFQLLTSSASAGRKKNSHRVESTAPTLKEFPRTGSKKGMIVPCIVEKSTEYGMHIIEIIVGQRFLLVALPKTGESC